MPVVPIEQNRVGIASMTDAKLRAPDMSGTGLQAIGAGMQQLGQAGEQFAQAKYEVQQNEENATAAAGVEKAVQAAEAYERDDQNGQTDGWKPRGEGHTDRVVGTFEQAVAPVLDGIKDKRLRQHWEQQVLATRGNITSRTESFTQQQRLDGFKHDAAEASDLAASRIQRSDDPNDIADAYDNYGSMVHAMAMPDGAKQAALDAASDRFGKAYLLGQIDRHPDQVASIIKSGKFDHLGAEALHSVQEQADVELRRAQALAQHAKTLADQQAREQIATVRAQVGAGVQVPPAVLDAAAAKAKELGDTSGAFEIGVLRAKQGINRETEGWTPQQYDAEIGRLRALGTKRTPSDDIRLEAIQSIAPARTTEIRSDPYSWAALNGHPAAPVNFSDPASIQARLRLQATVTASAGVPAPFFTKNEEADMRAQVEGNPNARPQVLNTIGNIAAVDRNAAARAARQVFPGDPMAARIVVLNPSDRNSAMRGQQARTKDRTLIDGPGTDGSKALAIAKYQHDVQPALALLAPDDADAVREMASNMYADWATTHGVHEFNEGQYGTFLQRAIGGRVGPDGHYQGGIGYWHDAPVVLPSNMSQQRFEQLFSNVRHWDKAHYPVYSNGDQMPPDALRQMVPILRPDGRYEFHGPNGQAAYGNDHQLFTVDFDAVARNNRR